MIKEIFEQLTTKMNEDPSHLENQDVTYQFNLTGNDEGTYQLIIKNEKVEYTTEEAREPKVTLKMSDDNFVKLTEGNLNPTVAYMSGKIKITGDLSQALKLQSLLNKYK